MGIFDSLTLQDFNPLNAIGGVISGIGNVVSSKMSKDSSEWSTRKQLEWERERAKNAHQWEVSDLEKAGLNKILTVNGSGAVTGNITPPMPDYSGIGRAGESILQGINSAQDIAIRKRQIEANVNKTNAEAASILDDLKPGRLKDKMVNKLNSETSLNTAEIKRRNQEVENLKEQIQSDIVNRKIREKDLKYYEAKAIADYAIRILQALPIKQIFNVFGQKQGTQMIKDQINRKINVLTKNNRYKITKDGIVDTKTGEILEN